MWRDDDMLGWRARIGLIIPSTNLLLETALPRMAPPGVTFHAARLSAGACADPEGLRRMAAHVIDAARDLASARVDLIAYCCTASSFVEGRDHDGQVIRAIADETGIRAVTTMDSIISALRHLQARRIALVSPYAEALERLEQAYLEREGFVISARAGMGITDMVALHLPSRAEIYRLCRDTMAADADSLLISCNALQGHGVAAVLERDLKIPVVTSLTATLWGILRAVGIGEGVAGYGRLLEAG
jgi:maleate isomerase